jgi:hypothetical protein
MSFEWLFQLLKWLSQFLLFGCGLWALRSDSYRKDEHSGRRRLTGLGWAKVFLFLISFCFFVVSDIIERRVSQIRAAVQAQTIEMQQKQLDYMRRVFLLQFEVTALKLTWPMDSDSRRDLMLNFEKIRERISGGRDPASSLDFLEGALQDGLVHVIPARHGKFVMLVETPSGSKRSFDQQSVAWDVLERSVASAFRGLRLELESGRVLLDPVFAHWPCELRVTQSRLEFIIPKPGVRYGELENATVFAVTGSGYRDGPQTLRLTALDPAVKLDMRIELQWKPDQGGRETFGQGGVMVRLNRLRSGPHRLNALIDSGSSP